VAPITALQVGDLLSASVQDKDGNLFITVEPEDCSGMAREVDPPLIFDLDPAATDGGHWVSDEGRQVIIDEATGVYHADFNAKRAVAEAERTIEACRVSTCAKVNGYDVLSLARDALKRIERLANTTA